jgi:hypothetical protein
MRRLVVSALSAALVAACATGQPGSPAQPSSNLTAEDVAAGFATAVVDGCAAALEAGKTLGQLANGNFILDSNRPATRPTKPGYTAWEPRRGEGIVAIDDGPGGCNVSAYGPPVESTFNAIVSALRARGYVSRATKAETKLFAHDLTMTANGRTVRVFLVGNEPGAPGMMSRFSGLDAFVSIIAP